MFDYVKAGSFARLTTPIRSMNSKYVRGSSRSASISGLCLSGLLYSSSAEACNGNPFLSTGFPN